MWVAESCSFLFTTPNFACCSLSPHRQPNSLQVQQDTPAVSFNNQVATTAPLSALTADEDRNMIPLTIVVGTLFLLTVTALFMRFCACYLFSDACSIFGALPPWGRYESSLEYARPLPRPARPRKSLRPRPTPTHIHQRS